MSDVKTETAGQTLPPALGSADGDTGAIALLRCLPTRELEAAYRLAKADETDKGQHSACLIGRELIRRASPPNDQAQAQPPTVTPERKGKDQ